MIRAFQNHFGPAPGIRVFRAPGRVNLIGEHTDYNLGFVLPIALELACFVARAPAADDMLRVYSEETGEEQSWPVERIAGLNPTRHWSDYIGGVARELARAGYRIEPQSLYIRSSVPVGGGLSSSAALLVSSALALAADQPIAPLALAELCQRAEVGFVGLPCGIMDSYISIFGREHTALEIDCRTLRHVAVPLPEGIEIVAVNTMVKHELGESAYRKRTEECAAAAAAIGIQSLRDANPHSLEQCAATLDGVVFRRARHVISENDRVQQFSTASRAGDASAMGRLLVESHRSLQQDYEVSCEELDFLVDSALAIEGVYGARMTGGGFGGCTVNLMRQGSGENFAAEICEAYHERFKVIPRIYNCRPAAGAGEVKQN
jgi:galactokinase